jgi:hypothetical protein
MEAAMILPSFGEESMWTRQHNRELERATPASGIDALAGHAVTLPAFRWLREAALRISSSNPPASAA